MDHTRRTGLLPSLLDVDAGIAASNEPGFVPADGRRCFVGRVIGERHPVLEGRVLVQYEREGGAVDAWLPVLYGASVRTSDTVLLSDPCNWCEPIVIGVISGFATRPTPIRRTAYDVELREGEIVEVRDSWGRPLLHIQEGDAGPILRLARADVDLEIAGRLRIRADSLELAALRGAICIDATDDVIVRGEIIHLN